MVSRRPRTVAASGVLVLALATAACGSSGAASPTPTVAPASSVVPSTIATVAPSPVASPSPALDLLWEKAGDTPMQGADPGTYWPAIDPLTGNVWVAVPFDGLFWIFTPDGTYVGSFGAPGAGPGQFNFKRPACPTCGGGAIAFAPDGSFFVADDGNNRIQKFDKTRHFVASWGTFGSGPGQFTDALGIATDGKVVFVYDDGRSDIQVFDANGTYLRALTGLSGWMVADAAGHLFAAGGPGIVEVDAAGTQVKRWPIPPFEGDHIGLAMDAAGRFYFNIQDRVTASSLGLVRYDPATSSFERWSTGGETLLMDPSGRAIYEANYVSTGWPTVVLRKYAIPTP